MGLVLMKAITWFFRIIIYLLIGRAILSWFIRTPYVNPTLAKLLSSYLLAFAAGDMQGITAKTKNGTLVGVYATKAHPASNLEFALDIAVRCIEFYEEYYGVKYPIPQSLHVALPDFAVDRKSVV